MELINLRLHKSQEHHIDTLLHSYRYCQSVLESGTKTGILHYHFIVEGSISVIRSRLRTACIKGNNIFSCKLVRDETACVHYNYKCGIKVNTLYTAEALERHQELYLTRSQTNQTFTEKMISSYDPNGDYDEVEHILNHYRDAKKGYDEYVIFRIVNAIQNEHCRIHAVKTMQSRVKTLQNKNLY